VARTIQRRSFTSSYSATADDMTVDIPTTDDKSGTTPTQTAWSSKMIAWQAHSYSTIDDLVLTSNARSPTMVADNEVLVRVKASSVNPLDVFMTGKWWKKGCSVACVLYFCCFTVFRGLWSGTVGHHSPSTANVPTQTC